MKHKFFWIVIIVVVVLIVVFVGCRIWGLKICNGITIGPRVDPPVIKQIEAMFGHDQEVHCEGEGGQEVKIGTGGRRKVVCVIKTNLTEHYELNVSSIQIANNKDKVPDNWILDSGWEGDPPPGESTEATIMVLDLPPDAPKTTLRLTIIENKNYGESQKTHTSYLYITPLGFQVEDRLHKFLFGC